MADEPDVFIKEYWVREAIRSRVSVPENYLGARLSESQGEKPKMGQIAADRRKPSTGL